MTTEKKRDERGFWQCLQKSWGEKMFFFAQLNVSGKYLWPISFVPLIPQMNLWASGVPIDARPNVLFGSQAFPYHLCPISRHNAFFLYPSTYAFQIYRYKLHNRKMNYHLIVRIVQLGVGAWALLMFLFSTSSKSWQMISKRSSWCNNEELSSFCPWHSRNWEALSFLWAISEIREDGCISA